MALLPGQLGTLRFAPSGGGEPPFALAFKYGARVTTRDLYLNGGMDEPALTTVLDLERELQSPQARADEGRLRQLLAPDFAEIGASGRTWDRETILDLLRGESAEVATDPIEVLDLRGRVLAPGVIQVSWDSRRGDRHARRTSIWCERETGWQQVHHQGTPFALPDPRRGSGQ